MFKRTLTNEHQPKGGKHHLAFCSECTARLESTSGLKTVYFRKTYRNDKQLLRQNLPNVYDYQNKEDKLIRAQDSLALFHFSQSISAAPPLAAQLHVP